MYNTLYQSSDCRCVRISTVPAQWPRNRHLKNQTILKRYFTPAQALWLTARQTDWDYSVDLTTDQLNIYINADSMSDRDWTAANLLFDTPAPGELVELYYCEELGSWNRVCQTVRDLVRSEYALFVRTIEVDNVRSHSLRVKLGYSPSIVNTELGKEFTEPNTSPLAENFYTGFWM